MANLAITAANVVAGSAARTKTGVAGVAVTAGQQVYFDDAAQNYKLAAANVATAASRKVLTALNGAAAGQPIAVAEGGPVTIGAALTLGTAYYLSRTAGAICPFADLIAGDYPVLVGVAVSTTVMSLVGLDTGTAI